MITLRSIHPQEIGAVKEPLETVFQALCSISYAELQAWYDPLVDVEHIESYYFENDGTCMVIADDDQLIGIGGINRVDADAAKLMGIFLLKEYRSRGLGRRLVEFLLEFARMNGYGRVRLMVATPDLQLEAVGLYTCLGFCPLSTNPNNSKELHMVLEFA